MSSKKDLQCQVPMQFARNEAASEEIHSLAPQKYQKMTELKQVRSTIESVMEDTEKGERTNQSGNSCQT